MLACHLCSGILEPVLGIIGICLTCGIAHFMSFIRRKPDNCKCECHHKEDI
jgi:hypothetical protein